MVGSKSNLDADAFVMLIEDKSPTDQQQDDFNEIMHQFAMDEGFSYPIFIKTAITSNKFHFWNCVIMGKHQWAVKAKSIFQAVLMHGAPLSTEIILRELVPTTTHFSIYSGMPLTFEYRIFIDADKKTIEKSINYWDFQILASGMSQSEDDFRTLMTFFSMFGEEYDQSRPVAEEVVKNALDQGYFDNLTGKWSVDIMLDYKNRHWLIDMAESEKSWGYH